jgi:N-acyl-D-aspartate/D-glutamate deacylase
MVQDRTVFTDATIIDGTGGPRVHGDVWVEGPYISDVTAVQETHAPGWTVVPVPDWVIAPGFIDVHSHADNAAFLQQPDCSKILQGVTTEVTGNCGDSLAPRSSAFRADLTHYLERLFPPTPWSGESFAEYWSQAEASGLVTNVAPLVGHGTLRILAMGLADRTPTTQERRLMRDALRRALDEGAFGLSTGLIYPPGLFSTTEEIVELAQCLNGRLYATHLRNESDELQESVHEALDIGRIAHCPVQISHHKACGPQNWGKTAATLEAVRQARQAGVNVRLDVYPYTAASTILSSCLPPWVEAGGQADVLRRLQDSASRQRIARDIEMGLPGWENELGSVGSDAILISATQDGRYEGETLTAIAQAMGLDPVRAMLQLLVNNDLRVSMIVFSMAEEDLQRVLSFPWTMIGSDGLPPGRGGKPHPRLFGTFPKVLGHYVREQALLDLETAIHKMTGLPAQTFGLKQRGVIRPGAIADLTIFDPQTIADRGTYAQAPVPPVGIEAVYLQGACVVRHGHYWGMRNGQRLQPAPQ